MAEQGPFLHRDDNADPRSKPLMVFFDEVAVKNEKMSQAGPAIYDRSVRIRLVAAGQNKDWPIYEITRYVAQADGSEVEKPDKRLLHRFRRVYEQWRGKHAPSATGTPLEQWPLMDVRMVAVFKDANVFTVQQLAELPDAMLDSARVARGREWRSKAKSWLEAATQAGQDVEARAIIERQQAQIDELTKMVNALQGKNNNLGFEKRGRGRPRKERADDIDEASAAAALGAEEYEEEDLRL